MFFSGWNSQKKQALIHQGQDDDAGKFLWWKKNKQKNPQHIITH